MLINESVAIDDLLHRLASQDRENQPTLEIIDQWRAELRRQRIDYAQTAKAMTENAFYRVARVESMPGNGLMPLDRIAEVITVLQSELSQFCKTNSISKDELTEALNHRRKEATGKNGARFQAYPLLYSETSEQGNREALESWKLETEREEAYLKNRKENGGMEYKPVPNPAYTIFKG